MTDQPFVSLLRRVLYVYRIGDEAHRGALKIGETVARPGESAQSAAHGRIRQCTGTAGVRYELLHAAFHKVRDHAVHAVLLRAGYRRREGLGRAREWFEVDLTTALRAIECAEKGEQLSAADKTDGRQSPVELRPEQRKAVDLARGRFRTGSKKVLWNAKMRFGKTLSALQLVKECREKGLDFRRTIIVTHRPVVDHGWFDDYKKVFYDEDGKTMFYGSRGHGTPFGELREKARGDKRVRYVYFASLQDLRGSKSVGGALDKNEALFAEPWDLVIIDEAHEGTQTPLGQAVLKGLRKHRRELHLSGTPFNLIDSGQFDAADIYTWDYVAEQRARLAWADSHGDDSNPYADLPAMAIYAYDLPALLNRGEADDLYFNLSRFFAVDEDGRFHDELDVERFLNLLTDGDDSRYPFTRDDFREQFRHTFWLLPGVREAAALQTLLERHPVFGQFAIVNVAGEGRRRSPDEETGDEETECECANDDALTRVSKAIQECDEAGLWGTITLSCGRLTTGVSVPQWTAVLMLAGGSNTSVAGYMQTIFRAQTPWSRGEWTKQTAYVFDFAPERTLTVLHEALAHGLTDQSQRREALTEFLLFCPFIALDGSGMHTIDMPRFMERVKEAYAQRVADSGFDDERLYDMLRLSGIDEEGVKLIRALGEKIGKMAAQPKTNEIDVNRNDTHEQGERTTPGGDGPAKKAADEAKRRKALIDVLRRVSIRLPLLVYGLSEQPEGLDIAELADLVDDASWETFMSAEIDKATFRGIVQYYDADVFRAASRKIHRRAAAADRLPPTERVVALADLFATFRDPDKETVLTPWRVVCLHLGCTLGGAAFFADDDCRKPLDRPAWMERPDMDSRLWRNPEARVLDVNSKTGLYPLYVAHSFYLRQLLDHTTQRPEGAELDRRRALWRLTLRRHIFVVCQSPLAHSITLRTLGIGMKGVTSNDIHAEHFEQIAATVAKQGGEKVARRVRKTFNLKGEKMKFDAVVGNPPYQKKDGGNKSSAKPLYNQFVELAKALQPQLISLIMPAKWYTDGKGLDKFRASMIADRHIAVLHDFTDSHELFTTADVAGGICIFLRDEQHDGDCLFVQHHQGITTQQLRDLRTGGDTFIRHSEAEEIVRKVTENNKHFMNKVVSSRKPFGLDTAAKPVDKGDLTLIGSNKRKGPYPSDKIQVGKGMIPQWKVMCTALTAEHAGEMDKSGRKKILSMLDILKPQEICTETYLIIAAFKTEEEAQRMLRYMSTKTVRFLISVLAATQHLSKNKFSLVPVPDLSSPDYPSTVAALDARLADKYGLTAAERDFIDRMIRPM